MRPWIVSELKLEFQVLLNSTEQYFLYMKIESEIEAQRKRIQSQKASFFYIKKQ